MTARKGIRSAPLTAEDCPEDCIYRETVNGSGINCGFLLATGKMRGCEPGPGCLRYVGRNPGCITGYHHKKPKWDTAEGRRMWEAGRSIREIAEKVGVHVETVRSYMKRNWRVDIDG